MRYTCVSRTGVLGRQQDAVLAGGAAPLEVTSRNEADAEGGFF